MSAADPTAAIAAYLLAQPELSAMVDDRVFRPELPRVQEKFMPRECIVVRRAGGYTMYGRTNLPVADPRIDVLCYGGSRLSSENIAGEVVLALKAIERVIWENTLLYWARIGIGPLPLIDPDTLWPFCVVSAQVMHADMQTV